MTKDKFLNVCREVDGVKEYDVYRLSNRNHQKALLYMMHRIVEDGLDNGVRVTLY